MKFKSEDRRQEGFRYDRALAAGAGVDEFTYSDNGRTHTYADLHLGDAETVSVRQQHAGTVIIKIKHEASEYHTVETSLYLTPEGFHNLRRLIGAVYHDVKEV